MHTLKSLIAAASLLAAGTALAQNEHAKPAKPTTHQPTEKPEAAKLAVGDVAPEFVVEKYIKVPENAQKPESTGSMKFQQGQVYVVEFWATWCGPCKAQFPHLSAMQKKYKDRVTFIGTNIWEDKSYDAGTLSKVEKFVKDQGDKMAYTIAFDSTGKMSTNWLEAAKQDGIPCAFVVGADGKIAWIGDPREDLEKHVEKALKKASHEPGEVKKHKKDLTPTATPPKR